MPFLRWVTWGQEEDRKSPMFLSNFQARDPFLVTNLLTLASSLLLLIQDCQCIFLTLVTGETTFHI